jgi:hypothetical protein
VLADMALLDARPSVSTASPMVSNWNSSPLGPITRNVPINSERCKGDLPSPLSQSELLMNENDGMSEIWWSSNAWRVAATVPSMERKANDWLVLKPSLSTPPTAAMAPRRAS